MDPGNKSHSGACDHFQPADLARLAEGYLKARAVPDPLWEGSRFGYGTPSDDGPFLSIYMEVERKQGNWVVVKLDRRKTPLDAGEEGLKVVKPPRNPV